MIQARILIIDDNVAVLKSLHLVLKGAFSTVVAVSDPQLIPALIKEENVDVVLLDMNFGRGKMDGKDGLFWLDRIKHRSGLDCPPAVVLITAFGDIGLAVDSLKQGGDDFIQKPWDNTELIQKITEAAEKRRVAFSQPKAPAHPKEEDRLPHPILKEGETGKGDTAHLSDLERDHIRKVLDECGGNLTAASKKLGISRTTLYSKMKRYGLIP
jgi:DNA-binding NtrC family response regulator